MFLLEFVEVNASILVALISSEYIRICVIAQAL